MVARKLRRECLKRRVHRVEVTLLKLLDEGRQCNTRPRRGRSVLSDRDFLFGGNPTTGTHSENQIPNVAGRTRSHTPGSKGGVLCLWNQLQWSAPRCVDRQAG